MEVWCAAYKPDQSDPSEVEIASEVRLMEDVLVKMNVYTGGICR